jgi:hypothetical protein
MLTSYLPTVKWCQDHRDVAIFYPRYPGYTIGTLGTLGTLGIP